MTKRAERLGAFIFGIVFLVAILALAVAFPRPTGLQYLVFRTVLALAAAGVAAMIPGFIETKVGKWLRAGGALAVFAIVYHNNPASLVATQVSPLEAEVSIQSGTYDALELVGSLAKSAGGMLLDPAISQRLDGKQVKIPITLSGVSMKSALDHVFEQAGVAAAYRLDNGTLIVRERGSS